VQPFAGAWQVAEKPDGHSSEICDALDAVHGAHRA
jgi:hypothetical protein